MLLMNKMPNLRGYRATNVQAIPSHGNLQVWLNGKRVSQHELDLVSQKGLTVRRMIFELLRQDEEQYSVFRTWFAEHGKVMKSNNNYALVLDIPEPHIIHIAGASGSGKTTLGNRLKSSFGDRIMVKDLDELRDQFVADRYDGGPVRNFDREAYQDYIDNFVQSNKFKPLVFVGLNVMPWWHPNHFYELHATDKHYIDVPDVTVLRQKCKRLLLDLANSEQDMQFLVDHNAKFINNVTQALKDECNFEKVVEESQRWTNAFRTQGYQFSTADEIFNAVLRPSHNKI
jgi:hypothetical protein